MSDDADAWGGLMVFIMLIVAVCYYGNVGGNYDMIWKNQKSGAHGTLGGYWTKDLCEKAVFDASKEGMWAACVSNAEWRNATSAK